jgi:hypothetical protein
MNATDPLSLQDMPTCPDMPSPISPDEFTQAFGSSEHFSHKLAERSYFHLLLDRIPSFHHHSLFDSLLSQH